MTEEMIQVKIPIALFKKIETHLSVMGFQNVEEYIQFVLTEVFHEMNESDNKSDSGTCINKDEEKVKERLKKLGYI